MPADLYQLQRVIALGATEACKDAGLAYAFVEVLIEPVSTPKEVSVKIQVVELTKEQAEEIVIRRSKIN